MSKIEQSQQQQQSASAPQNDSAKQNDQAQSSSTTGAKVAGALSVVSGYRYYRKAFATLLGDMRLPYLRSNYRFAKNKLKQAKQKPQLVVPGTSELPDSTANKSLLAHIFILLIITPAALISLHYTIYSLGLVFLQGRWLPQGNFGILTGPLFFAFTAFRFYISYKSVRFFLAVVRQRQKDTQHA